MPYTPRSLIKYIPARWRHRVVSFKNNVCVGGWKQSYYSHAGEDVLLHFYFKKQRNGFYVDIGAHHPRRYSNTFLLNKQGWRGINVDPDPLLMELFKIERPDDINLCCGIGDREGSMTFYRYSDPAFNTCSEDEVKRLTSKKWLSLIDTQHIPVFPLKNILEKYLPLHTMIDVLNVDVEGLDLSVLKSNDWETYRPSAVLVEDLGFFPERPAASKIYNFLIDHGYIFVAHLGLTLVFFDRAFLERRHTQ